MQVIDCQVSEELVIGADISVTVLEVQADRVLLAIEDPRNQPRYREETIFLRDAEEFEAPCELEFAAL